MMILQIFFSPDEIRKFFNDNGFQTIPMEFGRWDKQSHGQDRYVSWMDDVVIIGNNHVKAEKLFQQMAEYRMKHLLTPVNVETKKGIETQFNKLLKLTKF